MNRLGREERAALAAGMVAASLVPLNSTLIAVALPDIGEDLGVSKGTTAVLVTTYLVGMALLQPFAGRIGDRLGVRRTVLIGLVGFALSSAAAAAAPTFALLLVARIAQAASGAALIPNVSSLLRGVVEAERRGRAFGILGAGIGAGAAIGPVVGGAVVEVSGWRGIFLVSVPVAAAGIVLFARLDAGHVVVASAPAAKVTSMLRRGPFLAACTVQATSNFAQYSVLLVIPLALDAMGWRSGATGLVLSGMTVGLLVLSPVGGALGDRTNRRLPVVSGTALGIVGTGVLAALALQLSAALVVGVIVIGIGMGLATASLQTSALEAVDERSSGTAAGVMSTSRYVGSISSTIAIAVLVGDGVAGIRAVLTATVVAAVAATVAAMFIADQRDGGAHTSRQDPSTAADTGTDPPAWDATISSSSESVRHGS